MPMNSSALHDRLAVCSWSLQPTDPQDLVTKLRATGLHRVQLALDPLRESPGVWGDTANILQSAGITIVSGMFGCVGEDYSTLESIRVTGGIVPDAMWEQNLKNIRAAAALAAGLGLKFVTFHAGFVPHDPAAAGYAKLLQRLRTVAEIFAAYAIAVGLETGQETATALAALLGELNCPNVGVNFDPANLLLYDQGDPVQAVRTLQPWLRQVHIKDALRTPVPGRWGLEVTVGTGEVVWPAFFAALQQMNFTGDLVIEREAGTTRVADICAARQVVLKSASQNMPVTATPGAEKTVNVAVVGLGFMGVTHLRAYLSNPRARVVAVCDATRLPVNGVLAGVAGNIKKSDDIHLGPDVRVYCRLEDLLADAEVQLVDLCTPTPLHAAQVIAALQAGRHVFCEKPLARTSAAAREILQVAATAPGCLMPAMCMRFWPGWSWLKQVVTEQTYGRVLAASFRRLSEMPAWNQQGTYAAGNDLGGALFDLHIHDTDFVNYLFGRPAGVYSSGVIAPGGTVNHVVTQYHYPGGPAVYAEGGWLLAKGFNMAYTLHCERATLDFDLARGAGALVVTEFGQPPRTLPCAGPDGYDGEIDYLLNCLANARPPQRVTAQDGLVALEICEAEEQSLRTGTMVKI